VRRDVRPFEAVRYTCDECDGLLEVRYDDPPTFDDFGSGAASEGPDRGVWRYREALPFDLGVTLPEGGTRCTPFPESRRRSASRRSGSNTRG